METTLLKPPRTGLEVFEMLPEGTSCQLINDNIIMSPAPTSSHQETIINISTEIKIFLKKENMGRLFISPIDVYLNETNVYQPDIVFILKENEQIIEEKGIVGVPDLIIEVLSRKTAEYDKGEKKETYLKCGVKEYWIVDPKTKQCNGFKSVSEAFVDIGEYNGEIKFHLMNLVIKF